MNPHLLSQISPITNPVINSQLGNVTVVSPTPAAILSNVLGKLVTLSLGVAGVWFFFNLIRGGYEWISAGGDKESVQKARGRITNAVVGLVITFSLFAIINVLEYFFGFSLLTFNIPTP